MICINCMYSEYTETILHINDLTDSNCTKCNHPNSPFYNEIIDYNNTCRLFLDSIKYFKQKDRKEKIEEINRNKL